jgi:hypothetical protein
MKLSLMVCLRLIDHTLEVCCCWNVGCGAYFCVSKDDLATHVNGNIPGMPWRTFSKDQRLEATTEVSDCCRQMTVDVKEFALGCPRQWINKLFS